jgi:hypothetical protein
MTGISKMKRQGQLALNSMREDTVRREDGVIEPKVVLTDSKENAVDEHTSYEKAEGHCQKG